MTPPQSENPTAATHRTDRRHIVYLTNELPNQEYDTVLYTGFLMIRGLLAAGYDITVVHLRMQGMSVATEETRVRWLSELQRMRVRVMVEPLVSGPPPPKSGLQHLTRPLRKILAPRIEDQFYLLGDSERVAKLVGSLEPDIAIYWGNFQTIAACLGIAKQHFIAIVPEPPHLPEWFRIRPPHATWAFRFSPLFWRQTLAIHIRRKLSLRMLRKCPEVWCTVDHLTAWFQRSGIAHCQHVRNIVPDWGGTDWPAKRANATPTKRLKIVLMGAVSGTSTLAGLYFLARNLLPCLDAEFMGKFEIHICGGGTLPPNLQHQFDRPDVFVRGFVEDIVAELLSCDVFLAPTPIKLGSRVRIAYTWSVGCCVISHSANAYGLVEMKDGHNALLASNGADMARAIIRSHEDPELRARLQQNGRETFERYYSEAATVNKITVKIEHALEANRNSPNVRVL